MRSITEISQAPNLDTTKPKDLSHGMKVYRVNSDGPFSFTVKVTIPFEPSVFQGTGEESRKGIVLSIDDASFQRLQGIDKQLMKDLTAAYPDIASRWHSPLKEATEKYPAQLKAKINIKGDKICKCFNPEGKPLDLPKQWRRLEASAVIRVGGVYIQARNAGLLLDVTHLQYDPNQDLEENPFA